MKDTFTLWSKDGSITEGTLAQVLSIVRANQRALVRARGSNAPRVARQATRRSVRDTPPKNLEGQGTLFGWH